MLRVVVLILVLASVDPLDLVADVVLAVAERFSTTCLVVLSTGDVGEVEHRLVKVLARSNTVLVRTVAQGWREPIYPPTQRCSNIVHVLYGPEASLQRDLEHMSRNQMMGGPVWLIFLPSSTNLPHFFNATTFHFDVFLLAAQQQPDGTAFLTEVHRVSPQHPVRVSYWGTWSVSSGLSSPEQLSPYYRRSDLEGMIFNVATIQNPPMTKVEVDSEGRTSFDGYFGRIWSDLESRLNMSSIFTSPADDITAAWDGTKWTGLVGMVGRREVHVGVSEITMLPERMDVVDFLRPLYTTRYQLFFKQPGLLIQLDAILRPFHSSVWFTICAWLLCTALLFKVMHLASVRYGLEEVGLGEEFGALQHLFIPFSALVQQGAGVLSCSSSCRLLMLSTYICSILLAFSYSCTLTSYIAVERPWRPFDSLETLLHYGRYTLEQNPGSAAYSYFADSTDPVLQDIYRTMFAREGVTLTRGQAMERVCYRENVAHFGEFHATERLARRLTEEGHCKILMLEKPLNTIFMSIVLPKNSPYKDVFNHHLNSMASQGILHRFHMASWPTRVSPPPYPFQPVSQEQVLQVLVILLGGVTLSILVLLLEMLIHWRSQL